jgi:aspartyl aminopeptidase
VTEAQQEKESWSSTCQPGGRYYLTRNGSTIVAFAIGKKWRPGNAISMIGAHTDSPCLRIKPVSKKQGDGFIQVGVETYGGGLWHTWFDRDLGIAGRAMVRDGDGNVVQKLVRVDKPSKTSLGCGTYCADVDNSSANPYPSHPLGPTREV